MFGKLVPNLCSTIQRFAPLIQGNLIRSLPMPTSAASISNSWSLTQVRTNIRCYFPRPNETKRIKKHGWVKRMSTPEGRRVLMRRILKGRHVLSH